MSHPKASGGYGKSLPSEAFPPGPLSSVIVCPRGVGTLYAKIHHGGTYSFSLLFPTPRADTAWPVRPFFLPALRRYKPSLRGDSKDGELVSCRPCWIEIRFPWFPCLIMLTRCQILDIRHSFQFLSLGADKTSKAVGASSFQEQPQTGNSLGIYYSP